MSNSGIPQAGPSVAKTFEFTKRKRWADLLVTELAGGINFILSTSCTVLYCGPAVAELIGWRDVDLIDQDFLEFITCTISILSHCPPTFSKRNLADDQATFRACFEESIERNSKLLTYVRLKCSESLPYYSSDSKDMLFEIKGYPHTHEIDGSCFFATAKPHPSQNTEMCVSKRYSTIITCA